jgi:hypothetical protein
MEVIKLTLLTYSNYVNQLFLKLRILSVAARIVKCKGKTIPLQALTGPEGSRMGLPYFKTIGT